MSNDDLLLGLCAFISYFIESVFGFGGTVVFIGTSGFFFEIKDLIYISMLVSSSASATILAQTWRQVSWPRLRTIMLVALPGVVIGTLLVDLLANLWLLKLFAVTLVGYGVHGLLFPNFDPPRSLRHFFVAMGGLVQGVFTTGGPFVLMGCRTIFDNKTQLKATMAVFFLGFNLLRILQTSLTHEGAFSTLISYWWAIFPVIGGVMLGHIIHVRIPEKLFKQGLLGGITLIGILLLFK